MATRVLGGQVPYRDFWTMYSLAQFYVLVQQEIAGDLEKHHVRFLVLSRETDMVNEPNDSSQDSGVTILDDYIRAHFRLVIEFGPYASWRRM